MTLAEKQTKFINQAQTKVSELGLTIATKINSGYASLDEIALSKELQAVINSFNSYQFDWTDKDIEIVIDYYNTKARLNVLAINTFQNYVTVIDLGEEGSTSWQGPFLALDAKLDQHIAFTSSEIARLDARIDNLDFSNLVPQDLIDEVEANTLARHTHGNLAVLDALTNQHLADISSNNTHREDGTIHVTSTQKATWDNKVSQSELTSGLATKAATAHNHEIADVNGLTQALIDVAGEDGADGADGESPTLIAGTIMDGAYTITIDNTDPLNPILNLVVPKGDPGEDFQIHVYGNAIGRLNATYDAEDLGFTYLGTDDGILYIRRPTDDLGDPLPATVTAGWYSNKFQGYHGWTPILGLATISTTKIALRVMDWTGGTGTKPSFGTPGLPIYLGINGYTQSSSEALNIKGAAGEEGDIGPMMFPDASGVLADRSVYDDSLKNFVFLDTDTGNAYAKLSDASADWSQGYQWRGDNGTGVDGASAYETAVENGYVGTEVQWIASLKGETGDTGISVSDLMLGLSGRTEEITTGLRESLVLHRNMKVLFIYAECTTPAGTTTVAVQVFKNAVLDATINLVVAATSANVTGASLVGGENWDDGDVISVEFNTADTAIRNIKLYVKGELR